jgi:hypothetical protein
MDPKDQAMQEGKPRAAVKKGDNGRMLVKALLVGPPCLQRAAGHLKCSSRLTQGEPLGLQLAILIEELSALGAIPAWVTISVALLGGLDDGYHSDLLVLSFAFVSSWRRMARLLTRFNPITVPRR